MLPDEDAYNALIESAQQEDRLVVIKFFASWCRACKAMGPKYQRITEDWPEIEVWGYARCYLCVPSPDIHCETHCSSTRSCSMTIRNCVKGSE